MAVPGELRGYQELYEKYGSGHISWERLFLPTIALCRDGFNVSSYLANILLSSEPAILANPGLRYEAQLKNVSSLNLIFF